MTWHHMIYFISIIITITVMAFIVWNIRKHRLNITRDITGRKKAEAALAEESIRRRILFEQSPDGIVVIDPETARFLEFNTAAHQHLGYSREEFALMGIFDIEAMETPKDTEATIARVIRDGIADFETLQRTKQGEIRNVHVTAQIVDVSGRPLYHCVWRDITDRKRAENDKMKSEVRYRFLFENMLNGFSYCKMFYDNGVPTDFMYLEVNNTFESLTGLKDVAGKMVSEVIPGIRESDQELLETYGRVAQTGTPEKFERYLAALDMWFSISVYSPEKEYFVALFEVITERKRDEEKIRALLSEKELLLKEVHHRIKNNMTMIASLLWLQASRLSEAGAFKALNESGNRVMSMAAIYDILFRTTDFRYVSVNEYLGQVISGITASLPAIPGVTVEKRIDDFVLDSRVLFPIGIIINELVTNAYKYAFPKGRTGTITISVSRFPENGVEIIVSDNGVGISDNVDINGQTGFGMRLINLMVNQIEGTFECVRGGGTAFRINFKYTAGEGNTGSSTG